MSAKTSYVIRLSEDLYLDSNNNFLTGALPNLPIYTLAGGDLPLSDDTRKTLLRQILAVLPKDDALNRARKLLVSEISEVMGESKGAAEARIDRVLEPGKNNLNQSHIEIHEG